MVHSVEEARRAWPRVSLHQLLQLRRPLYGVRFSVFLGVSITLRVCAFSFRSSGRGAMSVFPRCVLKVGERAQGEFVSRLVASRIHDIADPKKRMCMLSVRGVRSRAPCDKRDTMGIIRVRP